MGNVAGNVCCLLPLRLLSDRCWRSLRRRSIEWGLTHEHSSLEEKGTRAGGGELVKPGEVARGDMVLESQAENEVELARGIIDLRGRFAATGCHTVRGTPIPLSFSIPCTLLGLGGEGGL